ncbi:MULTISPECIES: ABC transporter permease [unclassified Candidatus Frackibacter]|uniref:ABC transporter permease n=1 Tax=unclassified Candidatus Frackibacter TaxID=2648818 RepID=UPI00088212F3|nr:MULTISPECIES: ABC transporter permease [unclassified Candidatus Frackibacter]SDC57823.1 putative ABC transport system permease protein [Candidatus Frackibacter sp. WG11]SEM71941.1 putative ABC transport system permease protein [Candidatus Frackibacter sp. WG12]SFL82385.1 putative ABC transport system permease protein [Candidatus Frackibacter sp. WG13]
MALDVIFSSMEQGLVYGIMALGVYLTFRILDFPDLTVDGSFPLGAAVTAKLIVSGVDPVLATLVAIVIGALAGVITGLLNTKLKITGLLSGILTMTALYSINLRIMGRANIPLLNQETILTKLKAIGLNGEWQAGIFFLVLILALKFLVDWFLHTELGLALRATGDNKQMIRSLGVNTDFMIILGLALSNSLVALSGSLVAQYQGFADVGMGIGMIIIGLASVIIGEVVFSDRIITLATISVIGGSLLYRLAITAALRLGFAPTDLKIVTALLVVIALGAPTLKKELDFSFLSKSST